ncbi:glycosyltransferase family 2 protein [Xanthocytophaga agilis]|uniref:Glycosyltransferase n=1 Tax=Xanthocytophaga agilis TaxID=3048010 RepID=A0AAE3UJG2_9BACT|nr:glycosyltransferase [Xanthocytophaga agilis]MDJ1505113.1 glycosyltransferase [Xanthocytophaga agilis]
MKLQNEPLVSITLPTYNRPDYLKLAIASAINQTYKNIEIIVSDNGSPESAQPIVDSFQDSRIRFHRYDPAVSMFDNHINGFKMATGKYVASLHDDDLWEKDFLEKMVPPLEENPNLILTFCNQWVIDEHGKINEERTFEYNHDIGRHKLKQQVYQPFMEVALKDLAIQPASSAVIRREAIDWNKIPVKVGPMWDVYLPYMLAKTGMGAYFIEEKLTLYRIHSESETGKYETLAHKMKRASSQMDCYSIILAEEMDEPSLSPEMLSYIEYRWQHASTSMGIALLKDSKVREARSYLFKSLTKRKPDIRTLAAFSISLMPHPSHHIREFILEHIVKAHD